LAEVIALDIFYPSTKFCLISDSLLIMKGRNTFKAKLVSGKFSNIFRLNSTAKLFLRLKNLVRI